MTTRTRWGILATGGIATSSSKTSSCCPSAEVAAVGSRPAGGRPGVRQAEHGIARAHGSWAELAADPDVDVVYVATPHTAHHEAAKLCLEAGKAVLCEKPFTLDLATSRRSWSTPPGQRGLFLMEAMWMRTNPAIRRIRELVADGAIGEVTAVTADFGWPARSTPTHRLRNPALGGGACSTSASTRSPSPSCSSAPPEQIRALGHADAGGRRTRTPAMLFGYPTGAVATLALRHRR